MTITILNETENTDMRKMKWKVAYCFAKHE